MSDPAEMRFFDLGFSKGAEVERERIIKLLEEWGEEAGCFCCASDAAASEIIDLIKGEQSEEGLG